MVACFRFVIHWSIIIILWVVVTGSGLVVVNSISRLP